MQLSSSINNSSNAGQGECFAFTASLAFHVGLFLILVAATGTSTGVKLPHEDIIHVSLISIARAQTPAPPRLQESKIEKKEQHRTPAAVPERIESVDTALKQGNAKSVDQQAAPNIIDQDKISVALTPTSQPKGSGMMTSASAPSQQKKQDIPVSTGKSSSGEISPAAPRYLENTTPDYPAIARMRGYEGIVLLAVEIFPDGRVGRLKIKTTSGYAVLDRSALEAVKTWRFDPGRKLGKPVMMWVDVPVRFVLSRS